MVNIWIQGLPVLSYFIAYYILLLHIYNFPQQRHYTFDENTDVNLKCIQLQGFWGKDIWNNSKWIEYFFFYTNPSNTAIQIRRLEMMGSRNHESRHHSVLRGTSSLLGGENWRLQVSLGTAAHSSWARRLGTSLVTSRHVFMGWRSQVSSGTSSSVSASLSTHSSSNSCNNQDT